MLRNEWADRVQLNPKIKFYIYMTLGYHYYRSEGIPIYVYQTYTNEEENLWGKRKLLWPLSALQNFYEDAV